MVENLWANLVQVSRRWFQPLRIQEDNGRAVSGGWWIWVTRTLGKLHELVTCVTRLTVLVQTPGTGLQTQHHPEGISERLSP